MTARTPAWLVLLVVLGGCGSPSEPAKETDVSSSPPPSASPSASPSGPAGQAVADLAQRLGVDVTSVEVVSQEAVTWRDGSLGCAKPGFSYTQSLVEGSRITLRAGGESYEYHSGGSREPFWCEKPTQ